MLTIGHQRGRDHGLPRCPDRCGAVGRPWRGGRPGASSRLKFWRIHARGLERRGGTGGSRTPMYG